MITLKEILCRLRQWLCSLHTKGEIHYIGGAESLPPPLTPEQEIYYVERYTGREEDIRRILIEHNLRLVVYIARKFENTGIGLEDLISIGTIGLIKAVNTFRADKKTKLATYASRCIENEILMHLRKSSNQRTEISIDEPLNTDWDGNELLLSDVLGTEPDHIMRQIEEDVDRRLILEAVLRLPDREKEIISMRFGLMGREEMTQKDVADRLGISQSYISRLEKRTIARLKKEMLQRM
ncbi:MAG: RNA polymerase sporulation sigma factor SigE [Clostridia bacterium]|nr:RNA polymerase sporulation sigma factor SigE [Clostridia bacterium]